MTNKSDKKWTMVFCTVYFIAYMIRHCYPALLIEIIDDLDVTKQLASIALTGAFFTYGSGQFLSGWLGDRLPPNKIIAVGIISTSLINISIALFPNIHFMNVIWIISGALHSLVWAPLVRMVHIVFPEEQAYQRTISRVSQSSYLGTVIIYLMASLVVSMLNWKLLFAATGTVGIVFAVFWIKESKNIDMGTKKAVPVNIKTSETKLNMRKLVQFGMIQILTATMLIGCLRDGITTWMPVYFKDVYNMQNSIAIIIAVALPICAVASVSVASIIQKKTGNDLSATAILMLISAVCGCILLLSFSKHAVWDIILITLICCCLRGCSFLVTCYIPHYYASFGRISTISGLTNGALYIGSGCATYILAVIADRYGWKTNIAIWIVISLTIVILTFYTKGRWAGFKKQK